MVDQLHQGFTAALGVAHLAGAVMFGLVVLTIASFVVRGLAAASRERERFEAQRGRRHA